MNEPLPRRGFLKRFWALVIGGFVSLFPFAVGLAVFFDPLRKRKRTASGEEGDDGREGFLRVAALDDLLVDTPRRYSIVDDRVDAWNIFLDEPVGAVYLVRRGDNDVVALNVTCPHAGCSVDYDPDRKVYQCPCHNSSFEVTGEIHNEESPSPRGLDTLDVDPEKIQQGEVWVKFENFRSATSEKISES